MTCLGSIEVAGMGTIELVGSGVSLQGATPATVHEDGSVELLLGARVYFAHACDNGQIKNTDYTAMDYLGKKLSYKVRLGSQGCGCISTMYLANMAQNTELGECNDYYCDANNICGVRCDEIDIMETSNFGWASVYHVADDPFGVVAGYTGGGATWSGSRDWTRAQWRPGGVDCINTTDEMAVSASFPVDAAGRLLGMQVEITQGDCTVTTSQMTEYSTNTFTQQAIDGIGDMTDALRAGMTPVLSVWSSSNLNWLDGPGADGLGGGCEYALPDGAPSSCGSALYWDFVVEDLA